MIREEECNETELRQKIHAGSRNWRDYDELIDLLYLAGRGEEGSAIFQKALELPWSPVERARLCVGQGWNVFRESTGHEQALSLGRRAVALLSSEGEGAEVWLARGESYALIAWALWATDPHSAERAARLGLVSLERVMAEGRTDEFGQDAYDTAAWLYSYLEDTENALACCERYLKLDVRPQGRLGCLVTKAGALRERGQLSEAERVFVEALADPRLRKDVRPGTHYQMGLVQRALGRPEEARQSFREAIQALGGSPFSREHWDFAPDAYRNLAELAYELGDFGEAANAFGKSLDSSSPGKRYPWNCLVWLGYCYLGMDCHAEARGCFQRVLDATGSSSADKKGARDGILETEDKAAAALYGAGRFTEAAEGYKTLLSLQSPNGAQHWASMNFLAYCYIETGERERARQLYEEIMKAPDASRDTKNSAASWLTQISENAGRELYESGKVNEAALEYRRVLELHPEDDGTRCNARLWLGTAVSVCEHSTRPESALRERWPRRTHRKGRNSLQEVGWRVCRQRRRNG